jgi:hypothetical protein
MTLFAAPTPWHCPSLFVNDVRWWETFFLSFPRPPTSNNLDVGYKQRLPTATHGEMCVAIVPAFDYRVDYFDPLSAKIFSGKGTLKTSAFLHTHSTQLGHFPNKRMYFSPTPNKQLTNKKTIAELEAF